MAESIFETLKKIKKLPEETPVHCCPNTKTEEKEKNYENIEFSPIPETPAKGSKWRHLFGLDGA